MKKMLFTLWFFSLLFAAQAQIDKGVTYVGASSNLNFLSQSLDGVDNNSNQFNIHAAGGYFITENFMLGAELGYDRTWADDDHQGFFGVGPMARYYFGYVFAGASFLFQSQSFEMAGIESDENGNSLNLEVGYAAFVSDNIAVEPSVFYGIGMGDLYEDVSRFGIDVGFALYF